MTQILFISLGASLGAGLRWCAVLVFGASGLGSGLLVANILGCFLAGYFSETSPDFMSKYGGFLSIGFFGGLTTLSGVASLSLPFLVGGQALNGIGILAIHVGFSLAFALLGLWLGRIVPMF